MSVHASRSLGIASRTTRCRGGLFLLAGMGWIAAVGANAGSAAAPALRANARDLQNTEVVATLDAWMVEGRNLIWSSAFQLAWNDLCTLAGADLRMAPEDPSVSLLNRKAARKGQLDETHSFLGVGSTDEGGLGKMAESFAARFPEESAPGLPAAAESLPPGSVFAYGHLSALQEFETPFERQESPFAFNGTNTAAFGLAPGRAAERLAAGQVRVFRAEDRPGFVIELRTRRADHHLYLAMIPPAATLADTAREVFKRVKEIEPRELQDASSLVIPALDFDMTRDFTELTGRPLSTGKFEGRTLGMAAQRIRFKLDGRGEARKAGPVPGADGKTPRFVFNQPFLVLLQYGDSKMPYFAAWVDNAEVLVPRP